MIGFLRGKLLEKQPPWLLVEVRGVGYEVQAPMTTFYLLPSIDSEVMLHTHLVVREDAHLLYGFADLRAREVFRELIKVNGLGPKMALAILSALDVGELINCIQRDQINTLIRVPGIGRKTAERLLVELRDRVNHWTKTLPLSEMQQGKIENTQAASNAMQDDAVSALQALGYKAQEAEKIVATVMKNHSVSHSEELIRLALRSTVMK